jgi:hypothetical protein
MMFVKDPVYGSQGGQNKYTGKYFSLPFGTCEAYVPPVITTDEITTTEENTDTDTDTDTDTSTEWCEYICESDSSGYDPQACEEFCWWVNDPITNTRGENIQQCCVQIGERDNDGNVCRPGTSVEGDQGDREYGGVTEMCCRRHLSGLLGFDSKTAQNATICGGVCCPGQCNNGVCCAGNGKTYNNMAKVDNTSCNNSCCPSGMVCKRVNVDTRACVYPDDIDTIIPDEDITTVSIDDSYSYDEDTTIPGSNSSYISDDIDTDTIEQTTGLYPTDEEIEDRCGRYANGASAFCECCAANEDIKFEGDCNYYCYGYFYTTAW